MIKLSPDPRLALGAPVLADYFSKVVCSVKTREVEVDYNALRS